MTGPSPADLASLRRDLSEMRWYIDESSDLYDEIDEWIQAAKGSSASSLVEFVESRVSELQAQYPLYKSPDVDTPSEAFPDGFKKTCGGYPYACPILTDRIAIERRERELSEADGDHEARVVYQRIEQAEGCSHFTELIHEWEDEHADIHQRGLELHSRAQDQIKQQDPTEAIGSEVLADDALGVGETT